MKTKIKLVGLIIATSFGIACNNNPKVITASVENEISTESSGIFSSANASSSQVDFNAKPFTEGLHKVVVNEVLPASKYVYLSVNENDKQYWIATGKMEAKVGEAYFYKGGLLKTNFENFILISSSQKMIRQRLKCCRFCKLYIINFTK